MSTAMEDFIDTPLEIEARLSKEKLSAREIC